MAPIRDADDDDDDGDENNEPKGSGSRNRDDWVGDDVGGLIIIFSFFFLFNQPGPATATEGR